jgi:hypothetical protein
LEAAQFAIPGMDNLVFEKTVTFSLAVAMRLAQAQIWGGDDPTEVNYDRFLGTKNWPRKQRGHELDLKNFL